MPVPAPPSSTFNLPTFILALVGAASGVLSTAWNVVPYVSAGAKISVKIEYIFQQTNTSLEPAFEVKASNKRRHEVAESQLRLRIFRHRAAGELRFTVSELEVSALPGTRLIVYTPQDGQTRDRLAAICSVSS